MPHFRSEQIASLGKAEAGKGGNYYVEKGIRQQQGALLLSDPLLFQWLY
jgi:hypothetical protein